MKIVSMLVVLLLEGCSSTFNTAGTSEFSCPGVPGVMCKTPGQVYKMTQGDTLDVTALEQKTSKLKAISPAASTSFVSGSSTPMPIREPAKIMRIWIAPWTDKNDDLHWPSFVYTEIQMRKWRFGNPDFKAMSPVIPYKNLSAPTGQPDAASKVKHIPLQSTAALPPSTENP